MQLGAQQLVAVGSERWDLGAQVGRRCFTGHDQSPRGATIGSTGCLMGAQTSSENQP